MRPAAAALAAVRVVPVPVVRGLGPPVLPRRPSSAPGGPSRQQGRCRGGVNGRPRPAPPRCGAAGKVGGKGRCWQRLRPARAGLVRPRLPPRCPRGRRRSWGRWDRARGVRPRWSRRGLSRQPRALRRGVESRVRAGVVGEVRQRVLALHPSWQPSSRRSKSQELGAV